MELLRGAPKERNRALSYLYADHRQRLIGYIRSNTGSLEQAEDLFQETLISFYEQVVSGKFQAKSAISTYLYSIIRFKWLNELKRKGMKQRHHEILKSDIVHDPGPLVQLVNEEQKQGLLEVIGRLGEGCKQLLINCFYHNHSMKEIVAIQSFSSEQIARNKKYKCLKKLKELMEASPAVRKILKS